MSQTVFEQISNLKAEERYVDAWQAGLAVLEDDANNSFLKTSMYWVAYAGIKAIQTNISARQNNSPNPDEEEMIASWLGCIDSMQLSLPCEELDFRFFNLFKTNGEHFEAYVRFVLTKSPQIFVAGDYEPYTGGAHESPSLVMRCARQVAKGWEAHHSDWNLDVGPVLKILQFAISQAKDTNKIWANYDYVKCLVAAGRLSEAREVVLPIVRQKISESWPWGALAATYEKESAEASIACFSRGVLSSHEAKFSIRMRRGLLAILVEQKDYATASALVASITQIYQQEGWKIRPEYEELMASSWFDAAASESVNLKKVLGSYAENSHQYIADDVRTAVGIVSRLHESGKGIDVYIDPGMSVSVRRGMFAGGKMPEAGAWVKLMLGDMSEQAQVLGVNVAEPQTNENIQVITGELKVNPKGFGFVSDTFVSPPLLATEWNGREVVVTRVWDLNKKKGEHSWRAIICRLSS